jgi:hypothetical protein
MGHPDEGLIRAFLDDELTDAEARDFRQHLGDCPACKAELELQATAEAQVTQGLRILDEGSLVEASSPPGVSSLEEARGRVLARAQGENGARAPSRAAPRPPGRTRSPWLLPGSLLKAASIALLFTAVAASALPGSPVREWIARGWQAITGADEHGPELQHPTSPTGEDLLFPGMGAPETGTRIAPSGGGIQLALYDLPADAEIRVLWVEEEQAGIYAGEGTRFRSGEGRLEAHSPPGGVRVEIPSSLSRVLLTVDGRVLLRKTDSNVEIVGTVQRQTPREVVFGPGSGPNEG